MSSMTDDKVPAPPVGFDQIENRLRTLTDKRFYTLVHMKMGEGHEGHCQSHAWRYFTLTCAWTRAPGVSDSDYEMAYIRSSFMPNYKFVEASEFVTSAAPEYTSMLVGISNDRSGHGYVTYDKYRKINDPGVRSYLDNQADQLLKIFRSMIHNTEGGIKDESLVILTEPFYRMFPEGTLCYLRHCEKSTQLYIVPSIRYNWDYNILEFALNRPAENAPELYGIEYLKSRRYLTGEDPFDGVKTIHEVKKMGDKKENKSGEILGDAVSVASTLAFALGPEGVLIAAGLQALRFAFKLGHKPKTNLFQSMYSNIAKIVEVEDEKTLINDIGSVIESRSLQISNFQAAIEPGITNLDDMPGMELLTTWRGVFKNYVFQQNPDELPQKLDDLIKSGWGADGFSVFLSGVSVDLLCWRYFLLLEWSLGAKKEDMLGYVRSYTNNTLDWIYKAEKVCAEAAYDRTCVKLTHHNHSHRIEDRVSNKKVEIAGDNDHRELWPGYEPYNRFTSNSLYDFNLNHDISSVLAGLYGGLQRWSQLIVTYPNFSDQYIEENLRTITFEPQHWNQVTPQGKRWVNGNKVRYGIQFKYNNNVFSVGEEHSEIYFSDWIGIGGYAHPQLTNIPIDKTLSATSRVLWREFESDGKKEILATFGDNTTRKYLDTHP